MPISPSVDMSTVQPPTMWRRATVRTAARIATDTSERRTVVLMLANAAGGEGEAFEGALLRGGLAELADLPGVIGAELLTLADEQIRGSARKYAYGDPPRAARRSRGARVAGGSRARAAAPRSRAMARHGLSSDRASADDVGGSAGARGDTDELEAPDRSERLRDALVRRRGGVVPGRRPLARRDAGRRRPPRLPRGARPAPADRGRSTRDARRSVGPGVAPRRLLPVARPRSPATSSRSSCPNWIETAVIALAARMCGLVHQSRSRRSTASPSWATSCRTAGAKLIFVPQVFRKHDHRRMLDGLRPQLPALRDVVVVRDDGRPALEWRDALSLAPAPRRATLPAVDPAAVMMVMYTSGTTGRPRACSTPITPSTTACARWARPGRSGRPTSSSCPRRSPTSPARSGPSTCRGCAAATSVLMDVWTRRRRHPLHRGEPLHGHRRRDARSCSSCSTRPRDGPRPWPRCASSSAAAPPSRPT